MNKPSYFSVTPELVAELGFDPDALREKYQAERDKRVRPDGIDQYVAVDHDFSHYVDDPHVEPGFTRPAIVEEVEVAIIGGGFAGLLAGAHLRKKSVENFRIIEKGGDFGGAWYWNRYPGLMCDVESYVYIPMLEETGFMPTEKYATGAEIAHQIQLIAQKYDLHKDAYFQTQVTEIRWLDAERRWLISTNRHDQIKARFVIKTNSPLDRPKLPGIKGIDKFKGKTFHTSRWDYGYTGGNASGNLDKLGDKRVAVIGTGATAIQCVPFLAKFAEHLYIFQRTPTTIDVRENKPTDPEWVKTLQPGWQKARLENFVRITAGENPKEDLVNDRFTHTVRTLGGYFVENASDLTPDESERVAQLRDFKKMNGIRARVEEIVKDKKTAEALKPWYRLFCKRPLFSDDYLQTFNRPNVTLVDTEGRGVNEITSTGIVVGGVEYQVDCIIFATGFEVGTGWKSRNGCEIIGRNGVQLSQHWSGGMKTLHGLYTHGFPNFFHMGITQNGVSYAYTWIPDGQAAHFAWLLSRAQTDKITTIEATQEAEAEWVNAIHRLSGANNEFFRQCTPGYYNNEAASNDEHGFITEIFPPGPIKYSEILRKWRAGNLEGLRLSK